MPCRSCSIVPALTPRATSTSLILPIFFVNSIGVLPVPRRARVVSTSEFPSSLNLKVATPDSPQGLSANLRSPSFSMYQGDTESMSRTRTRTLGAGMENSAEFQGKYHLALGALRVSNIYRLLIAFGNLTRPHRGRLIWP